MLGWPGMPVAMCLIDVWLLHSTDSTNTPNWIALWENQKQWFHRI